MRKQVSAELGLELHPELCVSPALLSVRKLQAQVLGPLLLLLQRSLVQLKALLVELTSAFNSSLGSDTLF